MPMDHFCEESDDIWRIASQVLNSMAKNFTVLESLLGDSNLAMLMTVAIENRRARHCSEKKQQPNNK